MPGMQAILVGRTQNAAVLATIRWEPMHLALRGQLVGAQHDHRLRILADLDDPLSTALRLTVLLIVLCAEVALAIPEQPARSSLAVGHQAAGWMHPSLVVAMPDKKASERLRCASLGYRQYVDNGRSPELHRRRWMLGDNFKR
jgi:hypothetical protein